MGKQGRSKRGILPKHLRKVERKPPMPTPLSPQQRLKRIENEIYRLEYAKASMKEMRGSMRRSLFQCAITERIAKMKEIEEKIKKQIKKDASNSEIK